MRPRLILLLASLLLALGCLPLLLEARACNLAALELVRNLSTADSPYWYIERPEQRPSGAVLAGAASMEKCLSSPLLPRDRLSGVFSLLTGQPQAAEASYRSALSRSPGDVLARFWLGMALYDQGLTPEAVSQWASARAGLLWVYMGRDLKSAGNIQAGLHWTELGLQVAELSPASPEVDKALGNGHRDLGVYYREQGQVLPAITHFELAVQRLPERTDFRYDLSQLYIREGRFEEALEELNVALALAPRSVIPLCALGELYLQTDRPDVAESFFIDCLAAGDEEASNDRYWHARGHFGLSTIYCRRQAWEDCLQASQLAVQKNGSIDPAWVAQMGVNFASLLEVLPDRKDLYLQIGDLYTTGGRPKEALDIYQQGQSHWPDDPRWTELISGLTLP